MSAGLQLPRNIEEALYRLNPSTSRRNFLRCSGALVLTVGVSTIPGAHALAVIGDLAGPYADPDYRQLDTWIVIHPDNTATFYVGKTDGGQGTGTAFRQLMCDELDIAYDHTSLVMGRTDTTPDQGGSGGSDALERDGWPMRRVAAEARRVLLQLGAEHFAVPVSQLTVSDAIISVAADPARRISYAQLVGGQRFNVELSGQNIDATTGVAKVKAVNELRVVGQPVPRYDIPAKVDGSLTWAVDKKLPGMVHARNVRPPVAGAKLRGIDESSVAALPGFIRVVSRGNYVAVICEREEQAIRAARELRVDWQAPASAPFPASDALFDYMRQATPTSVGTPEIQGDPDAAFAAAAQVISADYAVPFQGHTAIGPAHALADPSDGQMTIYSNDMKSYRLRTGVADFLGMPREQVRVVYMDGPQVYGRTAADDAGFEAAFLAREIGRPVRVQWTRAEETAWDTKGPAYAFTLRGALDADGKVLALEYDACAADYNHVGYNEPDTVLVAQLMGRRPARPAQGEAETPSVMYAIPNRRTTTRVVGLPLIWETPLRAGNLRDPNGPQVTFAFESFIDELAAAANADPVQFRLDMLAGSAEDGIHRRARSIAVVQAAAEAYGWDARPAPRTRLAAARDEDEILSGRGIAYTFRNNTVAAVIAEVEVNRQTGRVWTRRLVCAHDCGLVVNPVGLERTIECGMLHALSRALWEEVQFDTQQVTSVDWLSHPSLRHSDTPESIQVVLVNGDPNPDRPDLAPYGAGEGSHKPLIAAVANAIYDATGVRLRQPPFRRERVLAALRVAEV
ncbi:MAG: molybdopterin-dependent oxidoreductase [Gammaproteobacteria bacterium]|nr:molybdopterin-dependent oxidoreductase [Gammaproteobacteria bacterium]MDH5304659.1 molybdopterin-dependent oxidoreductase [Gammaproteobacteria bacterium]